MARKGHHTVKPQHNNMAKHNTTRSGSTKDTRPKQAQDQMDKMLDLTGGKNPQSTLSTSQNRGQTLGNGPWAQQSSLPQGVNTEKWS